MATRKVILNCARLSPDIASVERIARLRVCVRRGGYDLSLANVSEELRQVIGLAGLAQTLGVEVKRQPEQREELGRIEEEGDLPDLPV
jgi:hypothetical protein